jgi:hypothetical protein
MSLTVTYAATCSVAETLASNTGSAPASTRLVTHTDYNESASLNSGTTPPVTTCAHFLATLSSGTLSVDLRALTGTNGAEIDGNGLKVQVLRIKNLGANSLTVSEGASNGHTSFFPTTPGLIIPAGGHVMLFSNDNGDDISATNKTFDLAGTSAQTSEWTVIMG